MLHFYLNKKILRYFSGSTDPALLGITQGAVLGQKTWLQQWNCWTSRALFASTPSTSFASQGGALLPRQILNLPDSANPHVSKSVNPAKLSSVNPIDKQNLTRKLTIAETRAFSLNGERQHLDILTAVQTRNIPRFLFLFILSLIPPMELMNEKSKVTSSPKLSSWLMPFSKPGKVGLAEQRIREIVKQSFRNTVRTTTRLGTGLKPGFNIATLCIPYLFLTGMALTCIQLFSAQVFISSKAGLADHNINRFSPELSTTTSLVQKTTNFYSFIQTSTEMRGIRGLSTKKFSDFCFESLRITPVCSKLFLLWALLQIWRGIRPGQSSLVDTRVQLRIVAPEENTKSLRGVQGIEKYHDILQGCVQSFRMNSSHFSLRSLWLYQRSWWRFFGFDLLQISFVQRSAARLRQVNFIDLWAKLRFSPTKLVIPWSRQNKKDFLGGGLAPKAYLFLGPPGSGKTLCAQALAGDAQVPLLCLSASEIQKQVESGTKIGPLRVRNLFQQTRAHTPCILFLDEIDSLSSAAERPQSSQSFSSADPALLGIKRAHFASMKLTKERKKFQESSAWSSVHLQNHLNLQLALSSVEPNRAEVAEKTSTLSSSFAQQSSTSSELPPLSQSVNRIDATQKNPQLDSIDRTLVTEFLIQMDSFSLKDGFCIIGTTNFLDALDSAFIRSGRFDRLLGLSLPGKKSRQALFEFYSHPRSVGPALRMRVSANLTSIQPSSPHASSADPAKLGLSMQSWFSRGIQLLAPWGLLRGMSQVSGALRVWPGTRRYSFQQPSTMDWKYWAEQTQGFSAADIAKIMNESFLHVIHTAISDSSKSEFNKVDAKLDHTPESIQKGIQTIVMSPRALGLLQES